MYNLITIGDALIDTNLFIDEATLECDVNKQNCQICLNFASKIPLTNSFQTLGGNAANVAAATAKLGIKTAILTSIGKDANGEMVKAELKKDKVDTALLSMDKKIKTRYSMVLNFKKERTILSYHQHRTYNCPKKLPKTDWVYYTSLSEGYEKFQEDLLKFLNKNSGINLAYNPGSIQLKNLEFTKQVLNKTNILIVNLEEAKKILNLNSEEKNIKTLINGLLNLGAKEVVITNSEAGAWAGNSTGVWHINSIPTEVVSKTGAGDAFSAAYLAARFYKHDIATALSWGIVNSSAAISSSAQEKKLLNKKEINQMISQFASIKPTEI